MGLGEICLEIFILKVFMVLCDYEVDENVKNFIDGFIRFFDASVCRGSYLKKLFEAWDKYVFMGVSENEKFDDLLSN